MLVRSMRLAIFDFDGTLVDTAPWFFRTLNSFARRHNFREVETVEGEAMRALNSHEILAQLGVPLWKVPIIARDLRRKIAEEESAMPLFDWVPELFATLDRSDCAIAIVSSNSEATIRRKLASCATPIRMISAGSGLFGKPARLRRVMNQTGIPASRTICIGDERRDVDAARSIGATCIAVSWGLASIEGLHLSEPDVLLDDPADLAATILAPVWPRYSV